MAVTVSRHRCDRAEAPATRVDRVALRAPRLRDDGGVVYDAVLVSVGDELDYAWGIEVATAEALTDPGYLEALRGLSVTLEHPDDGLISGGKAGTKRGRRVGAVVGATFDEADQAVVVELVVHEPADQAEVRQRAGAVSEGYTPTLGEPDDRGRVPQVARRPNHIALVPAGRAPSAVVRTDNNQALGGIMEEKLDKIMELLAAMAGTMDGYGAKLDAMAPANEDEEPAAQTEEALAAAVEERADAIVREVLEIRKRADALGVELPADTSPAKLRAKLAVALGADAKRTDDAAYCHGYIAAVASVKDSRTDAAPGVINLCY